MQTVVLGPQPAEIRALIERRHALGIDLFDEVWEGSYQVFGASRCDGRPGSALPPRPYGLRVALRAEGPTSWAATATVGDPAPGLISPEVIVTVVANPARPR